MSCKYKSEEIIGKQQAWKGREGQRRKWRGGELIGRGWRKRSGKEEEGESEVEGKKGMTGMVLEWEWEGEWERERQVEWLFILKSIAVY